MKTTLSIGLLVAVFVLPVWAQAASPLETVETNVNRLIVALGDESLSGTEGERKKKETIRTVSDNLFDFNVLSRRTLGKNWKKFTPDQRKEFVSVYRKLLESIYMDRLLQYRDEKVKFIKEIKTSETRAEVHSAINAGKGDIPIHYKMYLKDGVWRAYDLIIENASLVANYRSQFKNMLAKDPPQKVIENIREKVKDYS